MKFYLAPLAEYTDAAFRRMCARRGADKTFTEMASAAGLAHGSSATFRLLETFPDEGPVVCQLFGADPAEFEAAAHAVDETGRFAGINLNAGCPMPRIRRCGAGAALGEDPEKTFRCLCAIKRATTLPVSLKTRPGPAPERSLVLELLKAAEESGCSEFILHARFTSQMHGGLPHLDVLADVVRAARIPVCGNGGIIGRASSASMAATGVAAIMIGRAALAHPDIFEYLKRPPEEGEGDAPAARGGPEMLEEHIEGVRELCGRFARHAPEGSNPPSADAYATAVARRQFFRYFAGIPGAAGFRKRMGLARSCDEIMALASSAGFQKTSPGGLSVF